MNKKITALPEGGEQVMLLSGWRDLNSRPHGPEPLSEILNCSPHGLVVFHSREVQFVE